MSGVPRTDSDWERLFNAVERNPVLGCDTEFSGPLTPNEKVVDVLRSTLTGLSLAAPDESWYIPVAHRMGNAPYRRVEQLKATLAASKPTLVAWNAKAELASLSRGGFAPEGMGKWACTQVGAYLGCLDSGDDNHPFALKPWAQSRLGMWMADFKSVTGGMDFSQCDPSDPVAVQYACEDAEGALGAWGLIEPRLREWDLEGTFWDLEMPMVHLLTRMHRNGVGLDCGLLERLRDEWLVEQRDLERQWAAAFRGIKLQGPSLQVFWELGDWPREYAEGEPVERNESGKGYSTERDTLERMLPLCPPGSRGRRAIELKLRHSVLHKLTSTYTTSLVELADASDDGRIHIDIHQTATRTSRLSCSFLQNIPTRSADGKKLRDAFVATGGRTMIGIDFSQIEPRILAHMLGEGAMFDAYHAGEDMYMRMSRRIGKDRPTSKIVLLALMYGIGPFKIARDLRISVAAAKKLMRDVEAAMPEVPRLKERVWAAIRARGYVKTMSGFRRYLPDITSPSRKLRGQAERRGFNTPIQGSARVIMSRAMLNVEALGIPGLEPTLQIHDEELFEAPPEVAAEAMPAIQEAFEKAASLRVPLEAGPKSGPCWTAVK